ncbi:MAG: helix-turn-helix domain-containing protein [Selenomonadaceae bacterium]|nr:helix-turn-helix domain-containing protein [Selenomonadaceae bacterium]
MYTYDSEILNVEDLCEWLMIGRTTASRLLNSGTIKAFKINRIWKIPRGSVINFINKKAGLEPHEPPKVLERT